jgi:hypothetical protein
MNKNTLMLIAVALVTLMAANKLRTLPLVNKLPTF